MTKQNKNTLILISIITLLAAAMGYLNNSYLVSGMFIAVAWIVGFIMKDKETYDVTYGMLLF